MTISKVLSYVALHHLQVRTHRVSFQSVCHQEWSSVWNSDQQPRFVLISEVFQQILIDGLQTVPSTNFDYGLIHHDLRNSFGIRHEFLHEFSIHHAVLNHIFIHHVVLNQFFIHHDVRINFLIHHDLQITLPNFSPQRR